MNSPPQPDNPPPSKKNRLWKRPDRNVISLSLFLMTGLGLYLYFKKEKQKVEERKREEMANKSVGKVKVGGPFELINAKTGEKFTEEDLLGKFTLIYVS